MKKITAVLVVLILVASCDKRKDEAPRSMQQPPQGSLTNSNNSAGGVHWNVPSAWSNGPQKQMRVATYNVSAAEGDAENAECGVFYFGSGQGGDVQMNIDRWVGQFENAKHSQSTKETNGMKVEMVEIAGTYLAPSGPMMQSSGQKDNYRLLGAIIAAPEGSVFFKLTGPAKTVASAESDFNSLVESVTK